MIKDIATTEKEGHSFQKNGTELNSRLLNDSSAADYFSIR